MLLGDPIHRIARNCRSVRALRIRLSLLAANLGTTDKFVPRNQRDVDLLNGFVVLAHAEIQDNLDSLAKKMLEVTEDLAARHKLTHCGHHLVIQYLMGPLESVRSAREARYPPFEQSQTIRAFMSGTLPLQKAIDKHKKWVRDNSGIKESNVRRILMPLGFRETCFDPALMASLDSLGRDRGSIAHTSSAVGVIHTSSGSTEWVRLRNILAGLEVIHGTAPRLAAPIR